MSTTRTIVLEGPKLEGLELILADLIPGVDGYGLRLGDPLAETLVPQLAVPSNVVKQVGVGAILELRDPDSTPLALLTVTNLSEEEDGLVGLAGPVQPLRPPEHGPARDMRLSTEVQLSNGTVAVFSPDPGPADILRAVRRSDGGPLELIAEGAADHAASARLVQTLREVADLLPRTRVHFLPTADLGPQSVDLTTSVLMGLGASTVLDFRRPHSDPNIGLVILFTGLSGSGKSTVARAVAERLSAHSARRCVLLDGDHVRHELAGDLTFSAEDRHRNLERQAWVAARVAEAGGVAICAPIAPFAASRAAMRAKIEPNFRCILVYVSTPLEVAEARDRKGLYAKARAGLVADFTGIDSPYEAPDDADLTIDTSVLTVEQAAAEVVAVLVREALVADK